MFNIQEKDHPHESIRFGKCELSWPLSAILFAGFHALYTESFPNELRQTSWSSPWVSQAPAGGPPVDTKLWLRLVTGDHTLTSSPGVNSMNTWGKGVRLLQIKRVTSDLLWEATCGF